MIQIVVVGISYKNTLVEIRERFSFIQPTLEVGLLSYTRKGTLKCAYFLPATATTYLFIKEYKRE
jgi:glutamyl-tRNA reductase